MQPSPVMVGRPVPDFDLPCTRVPGSARQRARLEDYRGRWLLLMFYPRDFSLVCPTELTAISNHIEEFRQHGCDILAVSTDTLESHERWISAPRARGGLGSLNFPLASDLDGSASRAYGVYIEQMRVALRGLFIIDPNAVLQYHLVHNLSVGRRTDEVLRVLIALQTGGLCAENWSVEDAALDPAESLGPGRIVAHYRIEEQIGTGSFASVFRAIDTVLERTVALKVMRPKGRMTPATVLAEARLAAALSHPNICTVFGVDDSEGVPIIAMEYLVGRPLSKVLPEGALPPNQAARIAQQIASGMAAAHAAGIVHGDLKPANVIVTREGLAKIVDFGLSRRDDRSLDTDSTVLLGTGEIGSIAGTPSYMSPEQARGEQAGPASDIFSFGVILYEMLTGRKAFPDKNILHVLSRIRSVDAEQFAADVGAPFSEILRWSLIRDAAHRLITMRKIAELLA
ncbi:MAG TPA: redoxin domain-containing protein [Phycisphaerae bacterium]